MSHALAKHPDSIRTWALFDFKDKLPTGVTLTGSPTLVQDGGGATPLSTLSVASVSGSIVSVTIGGGTLDVTYKVTCRHLATNSETLELDALIEITDRYNEKKKWYKQPDEARVITFDFSPEMPTGVTLADTPTAPNITLAAGVSVGGVSRTNTTVSGMVTGGTAVSRYVGTCRCSGSNGDLYVIPFHIHVKEQN